MDRLKASINTGQNNCHENRTSILHCGGPKNARVQQNQRIRKHIFSKAKGFFISDFSCTYTFYKLVGKWSPWRRRRSDDAHDLCDLVGGHGAAVDDVDVRGGEVVL